MSRHTARRTSSRNGGKGTRCPGLGNASSPPAFHPLISTLSKPRPAVSSRKPSPAFAVYRTRDQTSSVWTRCSPGDLTLLAHHVSRRTYVEAIVAAIADEMRRDERVFMIGQDVGVFGGAMSGTKGLHEEFGPRRIREAPISESAMVGA